MQLSAGEDLLRNVEMFAITIGDVLMASGTNNSITVTRQNIGMIIWTSLICVPHYIFIITIMSISTS